MMDLFWTAPFKVVGTVVAIFLGVLFFIFWIWMIIDGIQRKFKNDLEKVIWIIVIIFTSWIGAIVYYFAIKQYNPKGLVLSR